MTSDFDTLWKFLKDSDDTAKPEVCAALARVQAASEQAEKVLAAARSIAEHLEDGGFSIVSSEDDSDVLWELHSLYTLTYGKDLG